MMDAAEAERAGLVSRVVPAAELLDVALAAAETICDFSGPSVMMAKEAVNRAYETPLGERHPLRAAPVPLAVRDRGPEGRHGRVPEAKRKPEFRQR